MLPPSGWGRPRRPRTPKAKCCRRFRPQHVTDAEIEAAVAALRGEITQIPSAVSAIKVGGKRAYKLAREGHAVELSRRAGPHRAVRCARGPAVGELVDVDVEVDCSSGTYIRALARDVGAALGVGGHLTALRRTSVGRFGLDEARTLDALAEKPRLSYTLDEACLLAFPRRDLTADEAESACHGRSLEPGGYRRRICSDGSGRPGNLAAAMTGPRGEIGRGVCVRQRCKSIEKRGSGEGSAQRAALG